MNARKLGMGAAFAGAGALALHPFAPKLHEKCRSKCSGMRGGEHQPAGQEDPGGKCCPQASPDVAEVV